MREIQHEWLDGERDTLVITVACGEMGLRLHLDHSDLEWISGDPINLDPPFDAMVLTADDHCATLMSGGIMITMPHELADALRRVVVGRLTDIRPPLRLVQHHQTGGRI